MVFKAVILVGGSQKGTRFRPLSLDVPKPLFPIAGCPTISHIIEVLARIPDVSEILVIGFFPASDNLAKFCSDAQKEFSTNVRYLQEFVPMGTAGGIYHFRDQILLGNPEGFFVLNADVCGDLPLGDLMQFHRNKGPGKFSVLTTEATRDQSMNYGCIVVNKQTSEVLHYVEKPSTFVSTSINCGVYLFSPEIFQYLAQAFQAKANAPSLNGDSESAECLWFENDIFPRLASTGTFFADYSVRWWSQIKSPAAAVYANRHYLELYRCTHPERLCKGDDPKLPRIIGNVYIHETAKIDASAVIGPNVSIGREVTVGAGVRIREAIVLDNAQLQDHCCILNSIIGWNSVVGAWARVEGTPIGPNPNVPFAKLESKPLFNSNGRLNPSICILGSSVQIPPEVIILNAIVLPHKDLTGSQKNQIIL